MKKKRRSYRAGKSHGKTEIRVMNRGKERKGTQRVEMRND